MTHWTEDLFVGGADVYAADLLAREDDADEESDSLLAFLADEYDLTPERVLDVACGVGRHATAFAERGIRVDGIDLSPAFVETARERAREAGVADLTTFAVGDMRNLEPPTDSYDLVGNFYTSFGYYDEETNRAILAGMAEQVAPGGALVLELVNRECVLANFEESEAYEEGGQVVIELREYDSETARLHSTRRVFDAIDDEYEFRGEFEIDVRAYAPVELRHLLYGIGFSTVDCYGGFDGSPVGLDSTRLLVVARP